MMRKLDMIAAFLENRVRPHSSKKRSVLLHTLNFLALYERSRSYWMDYQQCCHCFPILYSLVASHVRSYV